MWMLYRRKPPVNIYIFLFFLIEFFNLWCPHRSITWWCCLPTGPTWRTPAGCRSTRTSSRRRSRSSTTSTPRAPRSASTPTHRRQREAWPRLPPSSLPLLSLLSTVPSRGESGWRLGPSPPLMSLVRLMTMWSEEERHTQLLGHKQHFKLKAPLPLSWMESRSHYGSCIILEYQWFSAGE